MQKRDGGELKQCAIAREWRRCARTAGGASRQGKTTIEEVVRVTQNRRSDGGDDAGRRAGGGEVSGDEVTH